MRGFGGRGMPNDGRRGRGLRSNASSSSSSSSSSPTSSSTLSSNPLLKAALTSGGLSLAGDLLAQGMTHKLKQNSKPVAVKKTGGILGLLNTKKKEEETKPLPFSLDLPRAARMGLFGLLFYGPYQHWWYGLLDKSFPGRSTAAFASKVTLNQVALAPVVLAAVFAWNLVPLGRGREWPAKVKKDLFPTMVNGWKFWVPAASVNFWAIPLEGQVAYMSACGLLWTAYLSYSSN
jgi:protein Mpv17